MLATYLPELLALVANCHVLAHACDDLAGQAHVVLGDLKAVSRRLERCRAQQDRLAELVTAMAHHLGAGPKCNAEYLNGLVKDAVSVLRQLGYPATPPGPANDSLRA